MKCFFFKCFSSQAFSFHLSLTVMDAQDAVQEADSSQDLAGWCRAAVEAHPEKVSELHEASNEKQRNTAIKFLVNQVAKLSRGQANAQDARGVLAEVPPC